MTGQQGAEGRYQVGWNPGDLPAVRSVPWDVTHLRTALDALRQLVRDAPPLYLFEPGQPGACAIWCPRCGRISWNLNDVQHAYCGACQVFLEDAP